MLTVSDLNVFYEGLQALHGVGLDVAEHEFVCILGPNGAGKSTLLQTVAGLLKPVSGKVVFSGEGIAGLPAHEVAARGLALIPEEGWLFTGMSVEENLFMGAFPPKARAGARKQLEFVYKMFPRLADRRRQTADTLSGGERQMLAIGRGLMGAPKMIMLDEPSLGLSPIIIKNILSSLEQLNKENGLTILMTEQNIFHALSISDRAYVIENGRLVMAGPSRELMNNEHIKRNYLGL